MSLAFAGLLVLLSAWVYRLVPPRNRDVFWLCANGAALSYLLGTWVFLPIAAASFFFFLLPLAKRNRTGRWAGISFALAGLIAIKAWLPAGPWLLGSSYFLFKMISIFVETQRGRVPAVSWPRFLGYSMFFPVFAAGPLMTLKEYNTELEKKNGALPEDWQYGLFRILFGLFQKFILATAVFSWFLPILLDAQRHGRFTLVIALYAAMIYLYLDFSGYSSIAIGTARLFGLQVPENFALPLQKRNVLEFWRAWHITLQRFIRDYVFLPLFGGASTQAGLFAGIIFTMFLFGIWHELTWNFAIIGLYEGLVIVAYLALRPYWWRVFGRNTKGAEYWGPPLTHLFVAVPIPLFFIELGDYLILLRAIAGG